MRIAKTIERWFEVPGDKEDGKVKIKHLAPGEIQDIVDEVMVQEIIYEQPEGGEKPKGVVRQRNNRRLDREKTVLACVVEWKNFYDENGKKMACDEANVLRAIRMIDGFSEFVAECRNRLAAEVDKEVKAQKKI